MSAITLNEIAGWVAGRVVGDESLLIHDALPLQDATTNCITLVDNAKYADKLATSPALAAVVPNDFPVGSKPLLLVDKPHAAFETIVNKLRPQAVSHFTGIHPTAHVDLSARVGTGTVIQPGAYIAENVTIGQRCTIYSGVNIMNGCHVGDDCTLYPNVTLYPATKLGDRVLIHAGATLGAFGFGYRMVQGRHERTAQLGWVQVDSDVEIGAGTTIDRGTFGATRIGEGTKIDNQVHIGHDCVIGRNCLIAAQVGLAGAVTLEDEVVLWGQVGVNKTLTIGKGAIVFGQSGVASTIAGEKTYWGTPAIDFNEKKRELVWVKRIPSLWEKLKALIR